MSSTVLDSVAGKVTISAEARGLARDFCRRVGREAKAFNERAIGEPLRRRMARYPNRPPRDDVLRDLERRWRDAGEQQFRLAFRSSLRSKEFLITECTVTIVDAFRLLHWDACDYGVAVVDTWMEVRRGRVGGGVRSRMWIGSHALARWYQRRGSRSDEQLLRDIALGAATELDDRTAIPDLDDVRVPIAGDGGWRGSMMLASEDEGDKLVFYAKTFV